MSNPVPVKHGSGMLFKNFKKKQANHPDYIGSCEIDGKKLEIAAWIKPLKSGKGKFMSLAYSEPRQQNNPNGLPPAETAPGESPSPTGSAESEQPTREEGDGILV